eukprot:scaffold514_cov191-Pinguiococcus_pyrenoidosus.AAC.1
MRMTHEVRTPLASIVGAFDVLDRAGAARKLSDDGTVWDILRSSIKQLRIIVDDVVKLSQISSGSVHLCPTRASLRSIIGNILGVMHGRTQVSQGAGTHLCGCDTKRCEILSLAQR